MKAVLDDERASEAFFSCRMFSINEGAEKVCSPIVITSDRQEALLRKRLRNLGVDEAEIHGMMIGPL